MLNILKLKSHFVVTHLASQSKVILSCGYINCTTLQEILAGLSFLRCYLWRIFDLKKYNTCTITNKLAIRKKYDNFFFFSLTFFLPLGNIDSRITSRTIWSYHDLMDQVLWIFVSIP